MKSLSPTVSVIIPTRNRSQYLRQAVDSVLAQQRVNLELVIVNDGEGDIPPHPDARVRSICNDQKGAVAARNLGVAEARGTHIAFLDDDDWWSDRTHLALSLAVRMPFTFADGEFIFMDGTPPVEFAFDASAQSLATDNTILISGVCYDKSLHAKLGVFDETLPYYWDWDWFLRVARGGTPLTHLDAATVSIRVHEGNMSGESNETARRENLMRLAEKHSLGPLELKNHLTIAKTASL